jgi:prepilin-type N-terminal cleavage/methylation domain-containing protein
MMTAQPFSDSRKNIMRSRSGFTLAELLIVVAMIAVLLALLMPALEKAREAALTVHCASNLHQLNSAFHSYATDNRGVFPDTGINNLGNGARRWHLLWAWEGQVAAQVLSRYLGDDYRVMLCPSSKRDQSESYVNREGDEVRWSTYSSMTSNFVGQPNCYFPANPGDDVNYCESVSLSQPTFAMLADTLYWDFGEDRWMNITGQHPGGDPTGFESARGANSLTVDGTVTWRDIGKVVERIQISPARAGGRVRSYYW